MTTAFYSSLFTRTLEFPTDYPGDSERRFSSLDCDLTEDCTLRCSYCFKGDMLRRRMPPDIAREMVRWLARFSGETRDLHITIMGGEPMLAIDHMHAWVPFAVNYCEQRGKKLHVGITTNLTQFTGEHVAFFRKWHISMHTSIDGIPEVQDACRVFPDGRGSSVAVEKNLANLFRAWRTSHARSTIVPESIQHLAESFAYFLDKGFLKVAFAVVASPEWLEPERLAVLRTQLRSVLDIYVGRIRNDGKYYCLTLVDQFFESEKRARQTWHCGAAVGLVHVDAEGFLWPCHRFNGNRANEQWVLGHVKGGYHPDRRNAFLNINPTRDIKANCDACPAVYFCGCPCIAASWQDNGDLFDPGKGYCEAKRAIYETIRDYFDELSESDPKLFSQIKDWAANYKW
ncbi:MAG: SPASM domain-containing protein [Candidatus Hydrogenedentes bacterium]|nr:SPASM domain-containing protein [Candidatus Hydrogenedentota bacterium]